MVPNATNLVIIHQITEEDVPILLLISWALYISAMAAALCNIILVYITIKYKSLHKSYSILLAASALSDVAHELGFNVTLFLLMRGQILSELLTCFYAQIYAVIGVTFSYTSLLLIALDRLISIIFPIKHRTLNMYSYVFTLTFLVSGLFSAYMTFTAYMFALKNPNCVNEAIPFRMIVCMHSACFLNEVGMAQFRSCLGFNIATLVCYFVIWILLNRKKGSNIKSTRKIFKSLLVILLVVLFGWTLNSVVELTSPYFTKTETERFFVTRLGAFLINLASGSDAVILYFCSTDYNAIIKREGAYIAYLFRRIYGSKGIANHPTTTVKMWTSRVSSINK